MSPQLSIDVNCDLGEGMNNDALLMPFISSANISCGYHAGDDETIRKTIASCLKYGVAIGAHPSFNDRINFGRTEMYLEEAALFDLVSEQLTLFLNIAAQLGAAVHHVKPHGALYNMAAKNTDIARVIANAVFSIDASTILYGLAGSFSIKEASAMGLKTASEAFADRTYQPGGSLTPRTQANALLTAPGDVTRQVLQMVRKGIVIATTGEPVKLHADTICIHGDGAHAHEFAKAIHSILLVNAIRVAAP